MFIWSAPTKLYSHIITFPMTPNYIHALQGKNGHQTRSEVYQLSSPAWSKKDYLRKIIIGETSKLLMSSSPLISLIYHLALTNFLRVSLSPHNPTERHRNRELFVPVLDQLQVMSPIPIRLMVPGGAP
jgi:hypothetical protein